MTHRFRKEQTMRVWALGLLAVIMLGTTALSETLKEASITLDEGDVKPFMERLTQVIDGGFGPGERDSVAKLIDGMKPDDEMLRELSVKFDGREVPLRIYAVMGPHRDAKVAFFTSPELADRIQKERNVFLDALDR
jgi:hypothetical protein